MKFILHLIMSLCYGINNYYQSVCKNSFFSKHPFFRLLFKLAVWTMAYPVLLCVILTKEHQTYKYNQKDRGKEELNQILSKLDLD